MKYPMLIGTYQNDKYEDLLNVIEAGVKHGFMGFDTAPSYGTEVNLGNAIHDCCVKYNKKREDFVIVDKIDGWQMQESNGDIDKYVHSALKNLATDYIDVLLIHWPLPKYFDKTWQSFLRLKEQCLVKSIGISNVRVRHLKSYKERGIEPQCIQIERHPLRTCEAEMQYCMENSIEVMAYSPLCRMDDRLIKSKVLMELSNKYNRNIGQVILRWHIDTGSIPVFMSRRAERIENNLNIFDFSLTKDECDRVNNLNINYKIFLESWGCPGF